MKIEEINKSIRKIYDILDDISDSMDSINRKLNLITESIEDMEYQNVNKQRKSEKESENN